MSCADSRGKSQITTVIYPRPVESFLPPSVHHVDSSRSSENERIQSPGRQREATAASLVDQTHEVQIEGYQSYFRGVLMAKSTEL